MKGTRKDYETAAFVSDAARFLLKHSIAQGDAQGAFAVIAEILTGFDFRPVLKSGTGKVTERELCMVRDGQAAMLSRMGKIRQDAESANVDTLPDVDGPQVDAPPVSPSTLAMAAQRATGKPKETPPVAVEQTVEALAKSVAATMGEQRHAEATPEQMREMTVAAYHAHTMKTRQKMPEHNKILMWMNSNRDRADAVTVGEVLEGRA